MRGQGTRTARRGRSASARSNHVTPTDQSLCGTCNVDLGNDPIGCDKCETWVCSTEMCSGLPQNVIDTIIHYDGSGIQFVCLKCRVSLTSAGGSTRATNYQPQLAEIITQLAQQIKGICCELRDLKAHMQGLTQAQQSAQTNAPSPSAHTSSAGPTQSHDPAHQRDPSVPAVPNPPQPAGKEYRAIIRDELREIREQEKRRQSIIVKGLKASSASDFKLRFGQLCDDVMGVKADLSDVKPISGHPNIFRAKVVDDTERKLILDNAKRLKGSAYDFVYISRDLTYAQRADLYQRRQSRQGQNSTATGSRPADTATAFQSSVAAAVTPAGTVIREPTTVSSAPSTETLPNPVPLAAVAATGTTSTPTTVSPVTPVNSPATAAVLGATVTLDNSSSSAPTQGN